MSWGVDFTTNARADFVGLDPMVSEAVTDVLVAWARDGPPLATGRELRGIVFYESTVAERYLLGCREGAPPILRRSLVAAEAWPPPLSAPASTGARCAVRALAVQCGGVIDPWVVPIRACRPTKVLRCRARRGALGATLVIQSFVGAGAVEMLSHLISVKRHVDAVRYAINVPAGMRRSVDHDGATAGAVP